MYLDIVWVWTSITHVTISIKSFVKTEFSHQSRVVNIFWCKFLLISLLLLLRLHSDCRNHHRSPTVAEWVTEYILDAVPASCTASFFLLHLTWLILTLLVQPVSPQEIENTPRFKKKKTTATFEMNVIHMYSKWSLMCLNTEITDLL